MPAGNTPPHPLSRRTDIDTWFTEDERLHRLHWAALVDAGLIGNIPPTPLGVAARRDANDALFRSFRRRPR